MGFIEQQEVSGFKQDIKRGEVKQFAEKTVFEKRLLDGLGDEMEEALEHPERMQGDIRMAKKYTRKKKWAIWKENLKRIFYGKENNEPK